MIVIAWANFLGAFFGSALVTALSYYFRWRRDEVDVAFVELTQMRHRLHVLEMQLKELRGR